MTYEDASEANQAATSAANDGSATVSSLADRVRLVLNSGRVGNARRWSMSAGLSSKLVSTFLDRADRIACADMARGSVESLAQAAGVRYEWLAFGLGEQTESGLVPLEENAAYRIRVAREKVGISQAELERRAGLSKGYVSLIESNQRTKRMSIDTIARIATALGVRFQDISDHIVTTVEVRHRATTHTITDDELRQVANAVCVAEMLVLRRLVGLTVDGQDGARIDRELELRGLVPRNGGKQ